MKTYVALLRGINVAGRNSLPMTELSEILHILGCRDINTCLQSGNAVFRSAKSPSMVACEAAAEIRNSRGFEPRVLVLGKQQFKEAIENNPFSSFEGDAKALHFGFLDAVPSNPDMGALEELKAPTEQFALIDRVFYLLAPDGIGRSKLAARSEKLIACTMTDRNWSTVAKIAAMLEALEG